MFGFWTNKVLKHGLNDCHCLLTRFKVVETLNQIKDGVDVLHPAFPGGHADDVTMGNDLDPEHGQPRQLAEFHRRQRQ